MTKSEIMLGILIRRLNSQSVTNGTVALCGMVQFAADCNNGGSELNAVG